MYTGVHLQVMHHLGDVSGSKQVSAEYSHMLDDFFSKKINGKATVLWTSLRFCSYKKSGDQPNQKKNHQKYDSSNALAITGRDQYIKIPVIEVQPHHRSYENDQ
jgi:hypothetical protein